MLVEAKSLNLVVVPLTDLLVEQDGTAVVISHSTGVCRAVTINESGRHIWGLVDGKRTVSMIVAMVHDEWDTADHDEGAIRQDIVGFLCALETEGCLKFVPPTELAGGMSNG